MRLAACLGVAFAALFSSDVLAAEGSNGTALRNLLAGGGGDGGSSAGGTRGLQTCADTSAACAPWGVSSCIYPGVPEQCPKMCGKCGTGGTPTTGTGPAPAGCVNASPAECGAWGASSCIFSGVPEKCALMCGKCTGGPAPSPTPNPAPVPGTPTPAGTVKGYYHQTWQGGRTAPSGSNMGVAFTGWNDVSNALAESAPVIGKLPSPKYLDIGGGAATGRFTAALITKLNNNLAAIKSAGYQGVCYDIEEGDPGLASAFTDSFRQAKAAGLNVLVTVSHSQPYGITDAGAVMNAIFASADVDYLSPQLYTTGSETSNDYTAVGTPWSAYKTAKGKVIVSIVNGSMYADAQSKFAGYGITTYGYVAWA